MPDIGLVLSGGGAKGSYEIGVYKALSIYGITNHITAVSGTSVGALNAVLLESIGADAEKVWQSLEFSDLVHPDKTRIRKMLPFLDGTAMTGGLSAPEILHKILSGGGAVSDLFVNGLPFSQEKIESLIDKYVDFAAFKRQIFVTCLRFHSMGFLKKPEIITKTFQLNHRLFAYSHTKKKQIVLASAALPAFFCGTKGVEIEEENYQFYDGGFSSKGDNTPVMPLYKKGFRKFIVVFLNSKADAGWESQMPDAHFINIIPSEGLGGLFDGTMNLDPEKVKHDIQLGYDDTVANISELLALTRKP